MNAPASIYLSEFREATSGLPWAELIAASRPIFNGTQQTYQQSILLLCPFPDETAVIVTYTNPQTAFLHVQQHKITRE